MDRRVRGEGRSHGDAGACHLPHASLYITRIPPVTNRVQRVLQPAVTATPLPTTDYINRITSSIMEWY